jgi:hypothetical protein
LSTPSVFAQTQSCKAPIKDSVRRMGRANGSRECVPDDGLRGAIHRPRRHCERSEAIHLATVKKEWIASLRSQ